MKKRRWISFQPDRQIFIALSAFIIATLANASANLFTGGWPYFLLYQGLFGIGVCVLFPLYYTVVLQGEPLAEIGLTTKNWLPALLVALPLIIFSVLGQFNKVVVWPPVEKMIYIGMGLVASTLFEEVFFRGFLQTKFEKAFGIIPAILLSGAAFSLYHLGYPKFRDLEMLVVLFFVGTFFAISFSITRNIITSYLVNLPNAIITFFIQPNMLPTIDLEAAVVSVASFVIAMALVVVMAMKGKRLLVKGETA